MKNIMLILSLFFLIFSCESADVAPALGTIEGEVVIGPLCGTVTAEGVGNNAANPCGFSDAQLDAIYSEYKVRLKDANSGKMVAKEVVLDRTGLFSFRVPVGSYNVEVVMPEGGVPAQNTLMSETSSVKKGLEVTKNEVVTVMLTVNTGIR